jgi:hypothetical protein
MEFKKKYFKRFHDIVKILRDMEYQTRSNLLKYNDNNNLFNK